MEVAQQGKPGGGFSRGQQVRENLPEFCSDQSLPLPWGAIAACSFTHKMVTTALLG